MLVSAVADLASVSKDAIIEGRGAAAVEVASEIHDGFDDALQNYVDALARGYVRWCTSMKYDSSDASRSYRVGSIGKRFIRIDNGNSCHSFVERSNGYIWKSGGRKPALNYPRGNVFDREHVEKLANIAYFGLGSAPAYEESLR